MSIVADVTPGVDPQQLDLWRTQFVRDGFLVLPAYFSPEQVDIVLAAMTDVLNSRPMEVVVDDVESQERTFYSLANKGPLTRYKVNDLYLFLEEVRGLALESRLSELLRELLGGKRPVLSNSLTFEKGSGYSLHIDSHYMTPFTPGHLVATWMALEDVDPRAGPLFYYPGSHLIPLYHFRDGTRHATAEEFPDWAAYIKRELEKRQLDKKTFLARKGDVFIYHSDLVHGGSEIRDQTKKRKSLVCHYYVEQDCRSNPEWNLIPMNAGFWLERLPPLIRPHPGRFDEKHPFPEEQYLRRNPDLRGPLATGQIKSGFEHYTTHGYAEGRGI
jgi:phytanoyl-CoA hydroxylase